MTMTNDAAPAGGDAQIPVHTPAGDAPLSTHDAARSVVDWRRKSAAAETGKDASAEPATSQSEKELVEKTDAAPLETEAPGETEKADPEVETLPPIEPPRSWTTEDKAIFEGLPRETQERLADRERSRENDFRRSQNEAAEKLKGLTTKEQAVEQAKQQYEVALPILLSNLQAGLAGEFADIQSMADVQKMANEDWPRYARWDAQQKQVAVVAQEVEASRQRNAAEQTQRWGEFADRQEELLREKAPELADKAKLAKLQEASVSALKNLGFAEQEIAQLYHGHAVITLRDHRMQLLILDAARYRDAQAKAKAATAKTVPPVQRPGVSQSKGAVRDAELQNLNQAIDSSKGLGQLRAAAKLIAERRRSG